MFIAEAQSSLSKEQPQLILVGGTERIIVPDIESNEEIAEIMDPDRVAHRLELKQRALDRYPGGMPKDIGARAAYLAATGHEVRALYPDTSEIRIRNAQWKLIEELAKYDNRFNAHGQSYDDGLRQFVHDGVARNYPDIREVLDQSGIFLSTRDAGIERLYTDFPYFADVLSAAQAEYGFDDEKRGSLDLLYTENRIATMFTDLTQISARALPYQELPLFQREYSAKLGGFIDGNGNRTEGKIDRALHHYSQLTSYDLPPVATT